MRRSKRDYYEVLGVTRDVEELELKRAFRELARKFHPDINPSQHAEDRFKEANEAYAVLSDPKARARYDRYGFAGVGAASAEPSGTGLGNVAQAFDDLLGDIWRRRKTKRRGRDLRYTLEISFGEAALGCRKTIKVTSPRDPNAAVKESPREFEVIIPPGTKDGAVRMIRSEGEKGAEGAPAGDLHVIVRVAAHSMLRREGFDVWCEVPVTFPQAALGAVIEVPTLDGVVKMRIPAGVQSGRVFRMGNRGVPRTPNLAGPRGDQRVKVVVETPSNLSPRQRELIEELGRTSGEALTHPRKQSFMDKLRALFQE
ncbi:MAG TPA: DnaJ C-terminal domain-containing protein [Kofleriaceae bacterium]|nr:DnaJ C-terminal domain-containing protein [Kofleriaceae bacterium]